MLTDAQVAVAVLVVAAMTFACRLLPFVLLRGRESSELLDFLSRSMPLGVMVVLVAYTLEGVTPAPATWVPAVVGIAGTTALHLWRRSIALSLVGGTAAYVALSLVMA